MSQLSIGIEIRKTDLRRDLRGARAEVERFEQQNATKLRNSVKAQATALNREKLRIARQSNRDMVRAAEKLARAEGRALTQTQRASERNRVAGAAKLARMDVDLAKRQVAMREYFEGKSHRARLRRINEATQEHEKQTRILAKQHRATSGARGISGRRVLGGSLGTLATGARFAAGAAGIGGAVLLGTAVERQLEAQSSAADLANQAALAGDPRSRAEIQRSVLDQAGTIGQDTGLGRNAIIGGLRAFQEVAGDLQGAQRNIARFADIALASGTDLGDLGRTAGIFSQQLHANGLQGKELEDALDKVLRSGVALSAAGSVEFKDVARTAGRIAATSGRVGGGSPEQAIIDALALNQLAVFGGAASAEEAAVATQRVSDDLIKKSAKFKSRLGVDVFDKSGGLRPIRELLLDIVDKSGGDIRKLGGKDALFGERGLKGIEFLAKLKRGDTSGLTGEESKAGLAFLKGETSQSEIEAGAAFAKDQDAAQITKAFESLNMAVGKDLVPVITNQLIPALTAATPAIASTTGAFGKLADWAGSDPFAGLAVLVGASITKSLGGAAIGALVGGSLAAAVTASIATAGIGLVVAGAIAAAMDVKTLQGERKSIVDAVNSGDIEGANAAADRSMANWKEEGWFGLGTKAVGSFFTGNLDDWIDERNNRSAAIDYAARATGEEADSIRAQRESIGKTDVVLSAMSGLADALPTLVTSVQQAAGALGKTSPGGAGGGRSGKPTTKTIGGD